VFPHAEGRAYLLVGFSSTRSFQGRAGCVDGAFHDNVTEGSDHDVVKAMRSPGRTRRRTRPRRTLRRKPHRRDELATLGWVPWHNHQRLHGYLDDQPPTEFEEKFYATQ
jgi:transposase InsO family protein